MGEFIAIFLVLTIVSLLVVGIRKVGFLVSGKTKALPPKALSAEAGSNDTTTSRDLLAPGWLPDADLCMQLSARHCSIHGNTCVGLALVDFFDRERDIGRTYVEICEDCIPEATSHLAKGFVWKRSNYADHPSWGSSEITPHLLYDRYCRLISVCRIAPDNKTWIECVAGESAIKRVTDGSVESQPTHRLDFERPEEIVEKYAVMMKGKECSTAFPPLVGTAIPKKKLQNAIKYFAQGASDENTLLLIDTTLLGTTKRGYLLTNHTFYAKELAESGPVAIP